MKFCFKNYSDLATNVITKIMKIYSIIAGILLVFLISCTESRKDNTNFSVQFDQLTPGKLTDRQTKNIWPGARLACGKKDFLFYKLGITPHPQFIAQENGNNYLKVLIPGNHFGPITGAQWEIPLAPQDEYFFSYSVKFDAGFDFVKGGKLPGLAGGRVKAGRIPNGYDGWSARMMYWENGKLSFYLYFPNQSTRWGERLYLKNQKNDTLQMDKGSWHRITQHVKLNTPGKNDGILQAWFDGKKAFYSDTILFRKGDEIKTDHISYSVFMGGDDLSWAPANDQYIYFDDFRVSTQILNP
jgi:hypothetical protein